MSAAPAPDLDALARRLAAARRVTVLTGAGVSAASVVPTFRGRDGLWNRRSVTDLATPAAFARDPRAVWEWYDWRRQVIALCEPNRAHVVLAEWSADPGLTLITQNVDGLHERAGARDVVRFHGSLWEVCCHAGCADAPERWWDDRAPLPELPPLCAYCGDVLRPGVVWFGEAIPAAALERSLAATECDVFLVVGTSAQVTPAASLVVAARQAGAYTVEINTEPTAASATVDLVLPGRAEELLDELDARRGALR